MEPCVSHVSTRVSTSVNYSAVERGVPFGRASNRRPSKGASADPCRVVHSARLTETQK